MADRLTHFLKDVFPEYQDWYYFMYDNNFIDYQDTISSNFDKWVYKVLLRRFANIDVRYDTMEAFMSECVNVYEDIFMKFKHQKELIDEVHNLSLSDLTLLSSRQINIANDSITNNANSPNNINTPQNISKGSLLYISDQSYNNLASNTSMQLDNNKLNSYVDAINKIPNSLVNELIKKFQKLFTVVKVNQEYYWRVED